MGNAPTINDRPGLTDSTNSPFFVDLEWLRRKYNLTGCVLIVFDPKAANVTAAAAGRTYGSYYHMKALGDQILTSMDDRNLESEISTPSWAWRVVQVFYAMVATEPKRPHLVIAKM